MKDIAKEGKMVKRRKSCAKDEEKKMRKKMLELWKLHKLILEPFTKVVANNSRILINFEENKILSYTIQASF